MSDAQQGSRGGIAGVWQRFSPAGRLFSGVAGAVVVLDLWTKWLAVAHLTRAFDLGRDGTAAVTFGERLGRFLWLAHPPRAPDITVIEGFWRFRYAENPGAAWSLFAGAAAWFRTPFFLLVSLAAMVFIVYYYRRVGAEQRWLRLALAMVFGGAVGNFLDRVRFGYVVDFIEWHWHEVASWPIFIIADSAISVGVAIMLLDMVLRPKE